MIKISLIPYKNETDIAVNLIIGFWQAHNNYTPTHEEALADLSDWTAVGHNFYFIQYNKNYVGFVHLGSRGVKADWLEDIFVLPEYQRRGIGTRAIELTEAIVKEYSDSMYIEAAARNIKAIRLYHKIGYTCLNTITVRKDFRQEIKNTDTQKIVRMDFKFTE